MKGQLQLCPSLEPVTMTSFYLVYKQSIAMLSFTPALNKASNA